MFIITDEDRDKILTEMMSNFMRVLSAIFDENGGKITLNKDTFDSAELRFFLTREDHGDKVTIVKTNGQSELYKKIISGDLDNLKN